MVTPTLPPPQALTSDRLLGALMVLDECNFFAALMKQLPLRDVQIKNLGGNIKFDEEFEALQRMEGFDGLLAIGVVRDGWNRILLISFKSVCHTLEKFGVYPSSLLQEGSAHARSSSRWATWITPDNASSGMLEDLCLATLHGLPIEDCLERYITGFLPVFEQEKNK